MMIIRQGNANDIKKHHGENKAEDIEVQEEVDLSR